MGILVDNHCFVYGDNQYLLCNTIVTEYNLKNKSSGVAYDSVREEFGADEWRITYVNTNENP